MMLDFFLKVYIKKCINLIRPIKVGKADKGISYANWDRYEKLNDEWFNRFLTKSFPDVDNFNIRFYSVFGDRRNIKEDTDCKKVFYSGENLEIARTHPGLILDQGRKTYGTYYFFNKILPPFMDYALYDVNLSLGFSGLKNDRYLRFPIWVLYLFSPDSTYKDIKKIITFINNNQSSCLKEAVCINRHDIFGMRSKICDDLNGVLNISYGGAWRNNTQDLWDKYGNDKLKYMELFKFNICPENMDAPNYCTEKIFESFKAGCIPIYAGALNDPEPGVINRDAVIFWNLDGDNIENIKLIKKLNSDEEFYDKFMKQPKLMPYAVEYVHDRFMKLQDKIRLLLQNH